MNEDDEARRAAYERVGFDAEQMRKSAVWVSEQALDYLVAYYSRNLDAELAFLLGS